MLKTLMVAVAGLGLSAAVGAQELVEGEQYEALEEPVETQVEDGQIEVLEVLVRLPALLWPATPR